MGVDAETKRRLKAAASKKGVSVSGYCRAAIDKELAQEEERAEAKREVAGGAPPSRGLRRSRRKYGSAKPTTKTAVDYIREGREIREREMDGWLKPKNPS